MAKGQLKAPREKKKPKRDKSESAKPVSVYQQGRTGNAAPSPFGKKR